MPVHNAASFVSQAVESILGQSFGDFEFIIVNDASNDDSLSELSRFQDDRIVLINNNRKLGISVSLNIAIRKAQGIYIARQDADDVSLPDRLLQQMDYLKINSGVGLLGSGTYWIDSLGATKRTWKQPVDNATLQERLLYSCPFCHGSVVFRKSCWMQSGGYDEGLAAAEDYDLWLRMGETWDVANIRQPLYLYRWHDNMSSAKISDLEQKRRCVDIRTRSLHRRLKLGMRILLTHGYLSNRSNAERSKISARFVSWSRGIRHFNYSLSVIFACIALAIESNRSTCAMNWAGALFRQVNYEQGMICW